MNRRQREHKHKRRQAHAKRLDNRTTFYTRDELDAMTVPALREIAQNELGITVKSKERKASIMERILTGLHVKQYGRV